MKDNSYKRNEAYLIRLGSLKYLASDENSLGQWRFVVRSAFEASISFILRIISLTECELLYHYIFYNHTFTTSAFQAFPVGTMVLSMR